MKKQIAFIVEVGLLSLTALASAGPLLIAASSGLTVPTVSCLHPSSRSAKRPEAPGLWVTRQVGESPHSR